MMMPEDDHDNGKEELKNNAAPIKTTTTNRKCCNGICDTRKATIILSIVFLSLGIINLAILWGAETLRYETKDQFTDIDDDALIDILNTSYIQESIFLGIGIGSNLCSILGAIKYNTQFVGINVAWMVIYYFASIIIEINAIKQLEDHYPNTIEYPIGAWIVGGLLTLVLIYPMAMFIHEVNTGKLYRQDPNASMLDLDQSQSAEQFYSSLYNLPPGYNTDDIWTSKDDPDPDELELNGIHNSSRQTGYREGRTKLSMFGRQEDTIVFSTEI